VRIHQRERKNHAGGFGRAKTEETGVHLCFSITEANPQARKTDIVPEESFFAGTAAVF